MANKESAACNLVIWAMELEQEWLERLERSEGATTAWLPEVDLIRSVCGLEAKPTVIGHSDIQFHCEPHLSDRGGATTCAGVRIAYCKQHQVTAFALGASASVATVGSSINRVRGRIGHGRPYH